MPADDVIVDVIAPFKDSKEIVEMTIGVGMEFTIPGKYYSTSIIYEYILLLF